MNILDPLQTERIVALMAKWPFRNAAFREEATDHLCCEVETLMAQGLAFESALVIALKKINRQEFIYIDQQVLKSKMNTHMKNAMILSLCFVILSISLVMGQNIHLPDISPIQSGARLTAGFGEMFHPFTKKIRHHDGLDLAAPAGTPVIAPAGGIVMLARDDKNRYGRHLMIRHSEEMSTFYAHLDELDVSEGERILKGQIIGKVGNTGLSTAPHLHYEVILKGNKVDPAEYFRL